MDELELEKMREFVENIPLDDLWKEIRKKIGLKDLAINHKIIEERRSGKPRISFESENIAKESGIFNIVFDEVVINEFGSSVEKNKDGSYFYWLGVHISWHNKSGGSNGTNIFRAHYEDGRWIFTYDD